MDNTLVENPVSTLGSIASGDSFINSANDYTVVLPETMSAAEEAGGEGSGNASVSGN